MKNPTREFARRVYRLHRRPLLKASLIAVGPLCLLDCAKVFFTSSGLLPTWPFFLLYAAAACLLYPLTLSFTRTCVRTLLEADPALEDPFFYWKNGLRTALLLGLLLQGPSLVVGAGTEALNRLLPAMSSPWMELSVLVLLAAIGGLFWFTLSVFPAPYLYIGGKIPFPALPGESWSRMRGHRLALVSFTVPLVLLFLIPFLLFSWPGSLLAAHLEPYAAVLVRTAAALFSGLFTVAVQPYIILALSAFAEPLAASGRRGHR